ncbi:MAG TPA: pyridoxine 5'-phosphate synthase [Polyangiaceae bacterium]|nr:pyridoxine 5'-phosphate synthase [Polyangiaceae bacterium]
MRFHVNIDHIATLRNARGTSYPDPVAGATRCEQAGADGITAHLREDRRHIRDEDVERLRKSVTTLLNLEMAATDEMLGIAGRVRPDVITLVPERREERTTEGGLDVIRAHAQIEKIALMCRERGIKLSLFIEPDREQIQKSHALGAAQVELHTGEYCLANSAADRHSELAKLVSGAAFAHTLGLEVAAGHGLTTDNVGDVARIAEIGELNIGHAVISDAVFVGLEAAVHGFRQSIQAARGAKSPA